MTADPRLSKMAVGLMDLGENSVDVSAVSVWEVAVKYALERKGASAMPLSGGEFVAELKRVGLAPLAITAEHAAALDDLPLHHRDPFDRLLVAQAKSEGMVLLTHDAQLAAYGDCVVVV